MESRERAAEPGPLWPPGSPRPPAAQVTVRAARRRPGGHAAGPRRAASGERLPLEPTRLPGPGATGPGSGPRPGAGQSLVAGCAPRPSRRGGGGWAARSLSRRERESRTLQTCPGRFRPAGRAGARSRCAGQLRAAGTGSPGVRRHRWPVADRGCCRPECGSAGRWALAGSLPTEPAAGGPGSRPAVLGGAFHGVRTR